MLKIKPCNLGFLIGPHLFFAYLLNGLGLDVAIQRVKHCVFFLYGK
jgi:hypothetical protein